MRPLVENLKMDKIEQAAPVMNYAGAATSVGSVALFGLTDAQWLILSGIIGMVVAIAGLLIQIWVSWYRVKGYRRIHEMSERWPGETWEEYQLRLARMSKLLET